MNTILLVVILIAFVALLIVIIFSPIEHATAKSSLDDGDIIKMAITPNYVGGLKTVLENTECKLLLLKDKFIVKIAFKGVDFTIPFDKITNVEIKDGKGLINDIALSQLFLTKSIYIPKNIGKYVETDFIVITYINSENEEQKLILHYSDSKEFMDKYKETFNYWKCGYSNCDISEHAISLNLT